MTSRQINTLVKVRTVNSHITLTLVKEQPEWHIQMNNYIVGSYRVVIVITKFATRRANKAKSIVMY